jgi:AbrB family looped-hinge helix DNA binding protein
MDEQSGGGLMKGPDGKHIFGMVKVGEKGQIVIPKEARDLFGIRPGDSLMLVGDEASGIAVITSSQLTAMFSNIMNGQKMPGEEKKDECN